MKQYILILCILISTNSFSQSFIDYGFKYDGDCSLQLAMNNKDASGNDVAVFQCVNQSTTTSIYRIITISYKKRITDQEEYYKKLKLDYTKLGRTSNTTLKEHKAIQVFENVTIQGNSMKQISISTLYKNIALTLVLITNTSSYESLLSEFKNQFSYQ
jgi:hypothetical protein